MRHSLAENSCVDPDDVLAFLGGRLEPSAVQALERHVAGCGECRALLSALAQGSLPRVDAVGPHDADSVASTLPRSTGDLDPAPGSSVGRYVLRERLGAGGMGVVYAAHDPDLDRKVALKILRPAAFDGPTHAARHERLVREAQAMARLAHPNVVTVHEVGRAEGRIYIAMELVEGQTLGAWLAAEKRRWREIVAMLMSAGEGLAAAHAASLVHRDFKPENVLVGRDGRARVGDFGLARSDGADAPDPSTGAPATVPARGTLTGSLVGTPFYMAPEQFLGAATDARTDQFAFCVVLHLALVGEHPFEGDSLDALAHAVTHGKRRALAGQDPAPRHVRRVIERGLSVDPDERFPTMAALLAGLARDPRRRLLVATAMAVPLFALIASGVLASRPSHDARLLCKVSPSTWSDVWDGRRAAAVERAFLATGKPYAADAFAGVRRDLEAFSARWNHGYTEACEATRVRGAQSEDMLERRMVCLDSHLREARALSESLANATADTVENAGKWSGSLGSLDECNEVSALAAKEPPPRDAVTRARVSAVESRLAQIAYDSQYEKHGSDGVKQVSALVDEAHATGYHPLEARALGRMSELYHASGDLKAAVDAQEKGIWEAEAGHADELAASSWLNLMMWKAEAEGKYDDALAMTPRVTALLARLGGNREIEGRLHIARANLLEWASRVPEAEAEAQQAVATFEKQDDGISVELNDALAVLANIYFDQGKFKEAHATWDRLLVAKKQRYGETHPQVARIYEDIGTAFSVEARYPEAVASLEKAERLLTASVDAGHPARATVAYNLGLVFQSMGESAKALEAIQRGVALAAAIYGKEHPQYAFMLMAEADPLLALGRKDEAVRILHDTLAVLEKTLGPEHVRVSYALGHLADALMQSGKYAEARVDMERAIAIQEKNLGPKAPDVRSFLLVLAQIEMAAHDPVRALAALERSLAFGSEHGDPGEYAQVEFTTARALRDAHRDPARARDLATKARAVFAKDGRFKQELSDADAWLARRP